MTRLRDLGDWSGGNTPSKANANYWTDGNIPWVSPKDMKVDEITSSEDRVTELALKEGRVSLVPAGSVLVVTRSGILSHTLPVAVTKSIVTINQDLKALTPKPGIFPKYIAHALRGASHRILKKCSKHGTTVASIETKAFLDFEIPLVDVDEQHRVVAEIERQFSRLDQAVADLKRVKASLKRLKASVINAAVEGRLVGERNSQGQSSNSRELRDGLPSGWRHTTVGDLAILVEYGTSAKASDGLEGVPVLRMGNIVDGEISFDSLKYLPTDHEEFPKLHLKCGDLLFNRTNSPELVGKTAVFKGSPAPCSFASYLIRVRFNDRCRPEFVSAFINSPSGRRWVKSVVTQQVGQANVNGSKLKQLVVPLPPYDEQCAIVEELDRQLRYISDLRNAVQDNFIRAQVLRRQLLARAFPV